MKIKLHLKRVPQSVLNGTKAVWESLPVLSLNEKRLELAIDDFYDPDRIKLQGSAKIISYFNKYKKTKPDFKLYAFPDMGIVYPILKMKPPYLLTVYDGSNIVGQQHLVEWMEKDKVDIVMWNDKKTHFDSVPNIVRTPLVYNYVIANYKPLDVLAGYQLLERKTVQTDFDIDFWKEKLGATINLGTIPAVSTADRLGDCVDHECRDFMKVTVANPVAGAMSALDLDVAGRSFHIKFRQMAGQKTYYIYLTRLWFWGIAKDAGLEPKYIGKDRSGIDVTILRKQANPDILYP